MSDLDIQDNPFNKLNFLHIFKKCLLFSILYVFIILFFIVAASFFIVNDLQIEQFIRYAQDTIPYSELFSFWIIAVFIYILKKISDSNLRWKQLIGSLKNIEIKLLIVLAFAKHFFTVGFDRFSLYGLSFILPNYVENYLNIGQSKTYTEFFTFAVDVIIFAPIIKEIFYRGIVLHKIAVRNGITLGILISAFVFAIMHFRYDIVPLFISGIISAILYLKTKQLIIPIIFHSFYNLIVTARLFYQLFLSNREISTPITIAEYQEQFVNHINYIILFVAFSAPYLIYFIYKNFPRNYDINKLPYFINKDNQNHEYEENND